MTRFIFKFFTRVLPKKKNTPEGFNLPFFTKNVSTVIYTEGRLALSQ